jgi:hypothetical protein
MRPKRFIVVLVAFIVVLAGVTLGRILHSDTRVRASSAERDNNLVESERPSQETVEEDEGDEIRRQQQWFYDQRAYPHKTVAPGSLRHARLEAKALADASIEKSAPTAPILWSSFGPTPINTTTQPAPFDGPPPYAGRVTAIAHHPTNAAVAYLGAADGGVWKTTDAGAHWSPLFDFQPTLSIGSIAIDPQNPSTVYVGTGEANRSTNAYFGFGLFRSTDSGASWSKIGGSVFNNCYIGNVLVAPGSSSTIFVGAGGWQGRYSTACPAGIYRSLNGGSTWTRVISGAVTDIVMKPGTATTLFSGFYGSGVWTSTQNGDSGTWTKFAGGLPTTSLGRVAVGVTAANTSRLYAAIGNTNNGKALGLWTSSNGGTSWTQLPYVDFCAYSDTALTGQCDYDLAVSGYPANQNFVYVGGIRMMRYDGTTWTTMGYNSTNGLHVDIHVVNFDSLNRLWVGSDGGAYLKPSGVAGFTNLNGTLGITQFYPGTSGLPGTLFLGGTQDNGNLQYSAGSWNQFQTGDGGYTAYDSVNQRKFHEYVEAEVYRTTSTGTQTCLFTTDPDHQTSCLRYVAEPARFIAPLIQNPSSSSTLFVGTNRIWKTTNGGTSWSTASPQFAGEVSAIAQSKSNASVLYAAWTGNTTTGTFVARSTDGGTTWNSTAALPNRVITDVQVKTTAPNVAWVTLSGFNSGHVYLTQDYGATWTNISGNLPNAPANRIAIDSRTSPSKLFVATDVGVYWSVDGGATWGNTSVGLPNSVVMDVRVDTASNKLIAATHGRGAYSAPIP